MLLCLGDSLTFGSVGYSYIKYLDPRLKAINKGVNGDSTIGAYRRLRKYIVHPKYKGIDTYVIGIGTNDILLPYLTEISGLWKIQMSPKVTLKKCIKEDAQFEDFYEKYLKLLRVHKKKGILIGLPFIQLKDYPNHVIKRRNHSIYKLSKKYDMPFIDVYGLQKELFENPSDAYSWRYTNFSKIIAGGIMVMKPSTKDWFSKKRSLELTVDGVHFNSASAKLLAKAINDQILD